MVFFLRKEGMLRTTRKEQLRFMARDFARKMEMRFLFGGSEDYVLCKFCYARIPKDAPSCGECGRARTDSFWSKEWTR